MRQQLAMVDSRTALATAGGADEAEADRGGQVEGEGGGGGGGGGDDDGGGGGGGAGGGGGGGGVAFDERVETSEMVEENVFDIYRPIDEDSRTFEETDRILQGRVVETSCERCFCAPNHSFIVHINGASRSVAQSHNFYL